MTDLRKLSDVNFDELPLSEKFEYLKNSLTTTAPTFDRLEPELKKSRLLDWLANKPLLTWITITLVLALLVWGLTAASIVKLWLGIVLWCLVGAGFVVYCVYRKKVDRFFLGFYDRRTAKHAQVHQTRLEKYNADLQRHNEELEAYIARELTYEQAANTVDLLLRQHGARYCQQLLGVEEGELIALHYIQRPRHNSVYKKYGDNEVYGAYHIQYVCMTDNELYEINGMLDLLNENLTGYDTSRVLYSKIHGCEERRSPNFGMNYFGITTLNNDGSESVVTYLPSKDLMPGKHYYIYSASWAHLNKSDPTYKIVKERRKAAERLLHTPLVYDDFQNAVRLLNSCGCLKYDYREEPAYTPADVNNLKMVKLIIERAINRKIRESSM